MSKKEKIFILRYDDPFDIKGVSLNGSSPSLEIEAKFAVRKWQMKNSNKKDHAREKSDK
jgi:hypothetical protein